jgi:hypothetical protein
VDAPPPTSMIAASRLDARLGRTRAIVEMRPEPAHLSGGFEA